MDSVDLTNIPKRPSEAAALIGHGGRLLLRSLRLVWRAAGKWTALWGGLVVLRGALPAASVYLTKSVVDAFTGVGGSGLSWAAVQPVLLPTGLMAAVMLLQEVAKSLIQWIQTAQSENIRDHIKYRVHEKAAALDLAFFEHPESSDLIFQANDEASSRSRSLLQNVGSLVAGFISLVAIGGLLLSYGVLLVVLLLASTLPVLWIVVRYNMLENNWWRETSEDRRRQRYYDRVQLLPYWAGEVRALGVSEFFRSAYRSIRDRLRAEKIAINRKKSLARTRASLFSFVVAASAIGWMAAQMFRGLATLGDLALFFRAFNQGKSAMTQLVTGVGKLYADLRYIERLFIFLDQEPDITTVEDPAVVPSEIEEKIRFEGIDFRYPHSDSWTFRNFDIEIRGEETLAVVGPNGAGKSSLLKLLLRLYDPQRGSITWDGTDLKQFDPVELRHHMTALFQTPLRLMGSVRDNVEIGDIRSKDGEDRIWEAVETGGADQLIERLPEGLDTNMGKHFENGVELSGGEWQRVALSRALYRDAPLVLLDEPTSHMDSWMENRWVDQFMEYTREKTVVLVTHKFTTARAADRIVVMQDGTITESGTHEELLANGESAYATSWRNQRRSGAREISSSQIG